MNSASSSQTDVTNNVALPPVRRVQPNDLGGVRIHERRRNSAQRRPRNPRVSVVAPAMNEADNVRIMLPQLAEFYEVILVDGHSNDKTVEVAREVLPSVRVVTQTRKGKGNALACGFAEVTGDIVVMFDVDGSADPNEIRDFVKALVNGADFAKGSRFRQGGSSHDITFIRRLGNYFLNALANILLGTRFTDLCYGYNAFWADQIYILDLPAVDIETDKPMVRGDGFEIEAMINSRLALADVEITEVPSVEFERIHGETNLHAVKDGTRVLATMLAERANAKQVRATAVRRDEQLAPTA